MRGMLRRHRVSNGMSSVSITCPHCKAAYRVAPEHADKQVRCRGCNTSFVIPSITPQAPPRAQAPRSCVFCGTSPVGGNFCSTCGGRIQGVPDFDFASCKIPESFISQFPSDYPVSLDERPQ